MWTVLEKVKDFVIYDADKEFYATVFPDSVTRTDLLRLRRMRQTDLPAVLTIEKASYRFPWEEDVFDDCFKASYSCWVCVEQETILGYGILAIGAGEAHILNICIAPAEQGKGIGRKILAHLIEVAKDKAETLFLEVRPTNDVAIRLYQKMGFNEIGVRKGYYQAENGREDAIMFALELI